MSDLRLDLQEIIFKGRLQEKTDEFMAVAVLCWLEWDVGLDLVGNGWIDDEDEISYQALNGDDCEDNEYSRFLSDVLGGLV